MPTYLHSNNKDEELVKSPDFFSISDPRLSVLHIHNYLEMKGGKIHVPIIFRESLYNIYKYTKINIFKYTRYNRVEILNDNK